MGANICISEREKICSSPRQIYKKTIKENKDNLKNSYCFGTNKSSESNKIDLKNNKIVKYQIE
jgi:hypothetical protein